MLISSRRLELATRLAQTAGSCVALFTVGVFRPSGRERIGQLSRLFGHTNLPTPELPPVSLDAVTDARLPVTLREVSFVSGNVTLLELVALARLVRLKAPLTVFEIGTFDGRTTLNLAANAPDSALVHTLDLPMGDEHATAYMLEDAERAYVRKPQSGGRVHRSDLARKVKQHYGDSATFDFAPFVRDGVDFIFVDGSHAYEYARSDSLAAMSMLREGRGTIVWHDYNGWRGVSEALHELRRDDTRFAGVRWIEGTSLALLER